MSNFSRVKTFTDGGSLLPGDLNSIQDYIATFLPQVGDYKLSAKNADHGDWLLSDHRAVSRTTYADLFVVVGTTYGAGDGSTTFNLPDWPGRIPVAKGTLAEVDSLADNDGLPVGGRKPQHHHDLGTLEILAGQVKLRSGGTIGSQDDDDGAAAMKKDGRVRGVGFMQHFHLLQGLVGDVNGPLNTPAYQVCNVFIKS